MSQGGRPARKRCALLKALPAGGGVGAVPRLARAMHDYADFAAAMPARDLAAERIDGLGLAGPSRWVRSLTGALKLLR